MTGTEGEAIPLNFDDAAYHRNGGYEAIRSICFGSKFRCIVSMIFHCQRNVLAWQFGMEFPGYSDL